MLRREGAWSISIMSNSSGLWIWGRSTEIATDVASLLPWRAGSWHVAVRNCDTYLDFLKVAAGGEEVGRLEERLIAVAPQEFQQVISEIVDHLCSPAAVRLPDLEVFNVELDPAGQLWGDGDRLLDLSGSLLCRVERILTTPSHVQTTSHHANRKMPSVLRLSSMFFYSLKPHFKCKITWLLLLNFLPLSCRPDMWRTSFGVPFTALSEVHISVLSFHNTLVSVLYIYA